MRIIYLTIFISGLLFSQEDSFIIPKIEKNISNNISFGSKFYTGNRFLDQKVFSREGVFLNYSFKRDKKLNDNLILSSKIDFNLSNAFSKKITVSEPLLDIYFTTKIPNILSSYIFYKISFIQKLTNNLYHEISLKTRIFTLFYKKGSLLKPSLHSFGGFVSPEQNGSLPDLEKPTQFSYSLSLKPNNKQTFSLAFILKNEWTIRNAAENKYYPGLVLKTTRTLSENWKAPWLRN